MLTTFSKDGRELTAEVIFAQKTYLCLVEGFPDDDVNRHLIQNTIPEICSNALGHEHHFVIPPILINKRWRSQERSELPPILVAALFRCSQAVNDPHKWYSSLAIVWFQDCLEPLISGQARKDIANLIWRDLARDYSD